MHKNMFFEISLLRRFDRPSGHYQVNYYLKEINFFLLENNFEN
jgi:hypothetical protein